MYVAMPLFTPVAGSSYFMPVVHAGMSHIKYIIHIQKYITIFDTQPKEAYETLHYVH